MKTVDGSAKFAHEGMIRIGEQGSITEVVRTAMRVATLFVMFTLGIGLEEREAKAVIDGSPKIDINETHHFGGGEVTEAGPIARTSAGKEADPCAIIRGSFKKDRGNGSFTEPYIFSLEGCK